jgi:hypothetical protein
MAETIATDDTTGETSRNEFLNGGVVVEEKSEAIAEVTHICVGCGDEIRTFTIFADRVEEELDSKPICEDTTIECRKRGQELMEEDE